MKRFTTFVFALTLAFGLSSVATFAQVKDRKPPVKDRSTDARPGQDRTNRDSIADRNRDNVQQRDRTTDAKPGQDRTNRDSIADRNRDNAQDRNRDSKDARDRTRDARDHGDLPNHFEMTPQMAQRLGSIQPLDMDIKTAAAGFRNAGQFAAALHVSNNLNIPFRELKAKVTGPGAVSLGQAIHALKPDLSAAEAEKQAQLAKKQSKESTKDRRIS